MATLLSIAQGLENSSPYDYDYISINAYKNCDIVIAIERINIDNGQILDNKVYNDSNNTTHYLVNGSQQLRIFDAYYNRIRIFIDVSNITFSDSSKLSSQPVVNGSITYIKQDINFEAFKAGSPISQNYYILNNDCASNLARSLCDIIVTI